VHEVKWWHGDELETPKEGNVFAFVNLSIRNLGPGIAHGIGPSEFQTRDEDGVLRAEEYAAFLRDEYMESGVDLMPDARVSGWVSFQVPKTGSIDLILAPYRTNKFGEGRYLSFKLRQTEAWAEAGNKTGAATETAPKSVSPTHTPATTKPQTGESERAVGKNYIAVQETGGITIEIARAEFADKEWIEDEKNVSFVAGCSEAFGNVDTVAAFILKITNASGEAVWLHPEEGTVTVGNEHIPVSHYSCSISNMEVIGGRLWPRTTRTGGFWFGVRQTEWNKITKVQYHVDPPLDAELNQLGEEFTIEFDMTNAEFEPVPDTF
jgi:hypothetical protein